MDERTRELTRLWMSAQPIVSSFVSSLVPNFTARDDIMQEIITAVIESFDRYDPQRPFIGWLLGIARNQIAVHRRKLSRDPVYFDEGAVDALVDSFTNIVSRDMHKLEFLQDCLERLSDRDRNLCDLRYEQDLKPAGIGTRLGMTPNNVSKALQRIRDQLRNCIERQVTRAGRAT